MISTAFTGEVFGSRRTSESTDHGPSTKIHLLTIHSRIESAYRLRTFVVDFDNNSIVSQAVNQAVTASNAGPPPHLGWEVVSGSQYNTPQDLADLVIDEKLWAAVTSQ